MLPQAGDIGFVHNTDFTAWWIRFAQRRKYGKVKAAEYNHVFVVVDDSGLIIEADPVGVELNHLEKYKGTDVLILRPDYNPGRAADCVAAARERLGDRYGFLTIASCALSLLTGTKLRFGISGQEICSGAAAEDLTRANMDCGPDESFDTPADLLSIVRWTPDIITL